MIPRPFAFATALAIATALLSVSEPSFAQGAPASGPVHQTSLVHIDHGADMVLEQQLGWGWVEVCAGSCDRALFTFETYRINGAGIRPSKPFQLEPSSGEPVQLVVSPASSSLRGLGIASTALGGATIGIGLGLLLMGAWTESCSNCNGGYANTTMLNVGWSFVGGGVVGLIAGIVLVSTNRYTSVVSKTGDVLIPLTPSGGKSVEGRALPWVPVIWGGTF